MDDDTSTICKIRSEVNPEIEKCSDKNHTFKNFTNHLFTLQKEKYKRILSTKVINHIKKCFSYAVSSNREDPQTEIPYGRYLSDKELHQELVKIFTLYAEQSDKLSTLESTQNNENFNQIVARKNPKNNFYSGSESTSGRVAAATCEKNIGPHYVTQINDRLSLSPGSFIVKHADRKMRKRQSNAEKYCTKEFKRRRVELKKSASTASSSLETREGVTYRSGVLSTSSNIPDSDIETIPPPPEQLQQTPLPPCQYSRVYFDLETTGLGLSAGIIQLAARYGETEFNQYVIPKTSINPMASKITGLTYDGTLLYKNGVALPAVPIEVCLASFFDWLKNSGMNHPVLFAHNARKFDSLIFVTCTSLLNSGKEEEGKIICGFCDTLPMLKEHASGSHLNFSLETLVKDILGCSFSAHDAVEDCRYLQKVVEHHSIDSFYLQYTFTMKYIIDIIKQMETSKQNLQTLMPLVQNHVISESMCKKISFSGLALKHLELAHQRGGFDGIHSLFTETFQGKPRITKHTSIITAVSKFIEER
ncbi:uncharacterized protein LOC134237171 [Saccostrea cucullata]|uniref:uncharacterized protein LOC134237171 n=1 Tax=Saccostrea cuccullata TaxID=36930 RepID=UPI002ED55A50